MLKVKKQTSNRSDHRRQPAAGFTIIETLIVLAIAGLILMIVFEAIPALQRNGRNNQRKQDVQSILEGVSHWELVHSGNLPTSANLCSYLQQYGNLTFYDVTSCGTSAVQLHPYTYPPGTSLRPTISPATDINTVDLYNYAKCDSNNDGGASGNGAGYNDVVAVYAIENSNGGSSQCQNI